MGPQSFPVGAKSIFRSNQFKSRLGFVRGRFELGEENLKSTS
jgi:hypothetical protein